MKKTILTILILLIIATTYVKTTEFSWEESETGGMTFSANTQITTQDCKEGGKRICDFILSICEKGKDLLDTVEEFRKRNNTAKK